MEKTARILVMHPDMQALFPNKPKRWEFVEVLDDIDQTISESGADIEVLLSASIEKLDKEMLDRLPNLKMIASISAGFSNVDLDECRARKILVTNAPGLNSGCRRHYDDLAAVEFPAKSPIHNDRSMGD